MKNELLLILTPQSIAVRRHRHARNPQGDAATKVAYARSYKGPFAIWILIQSKFEEICLTSAPFRHHSCFTLLRSKHLAMPDQ